jgi:hypothetical protein
MMKMKDKMSKRESECGISKGGKYFINGISKE